MLLSKTLIIRDEISRKLDPDHNFGEMTGPYVKKMLEDRTKASHILKSAEKTVMDLVNLMKNFPRRMNHLLTKAEKGTLKA